MGESFTWSFFWRWDVTRDVDFQDGYGWLVVSSWGSKSGPNRKSPKGAWGLRRGDIPRSNWSMYWVIVDPLDPFNVAYAGGPYSPRHFRTLDGGENWEQTKNRVIFATMLDN